MLSSSARGGFAALQFILLEIPQYESECILNQLVLVLLLLP